MMAFAISFLNILLKYVFKILKVTKLLANKTAFCPSNVKERLQLCNFKFKFCKYLLNLEMV